MVVWAICWSETPRAIRCAWRSAGWKDMRAEMHFQGKWVQKASELHWFLANFNVLTAPGAFASAFLAGAINSVAGGGTLLSFPTLIWLGLNSVTANATSTVAIWPGTVGSMWGYRRELRQAEARFRILLVPSLIGGLLGALLLRWTSSATFDKLVPYLILFATILLSAQ